jgi:hypothetical protein
MNPAPPIQLRLRRTFDGEILLHHDAPYSMQVTLLEEESADHPTGWSQSIPSGTFAPLRFPGPDHDWVDISGLGEKGKTEHCPACGATRITSPRG